MSWIRSRKHLLERLRGWLDERRLSQGGYAEITDDDVSELWHLVDGMIHLKCQEDPDGDVPIDFKIIDRTKCAPMHFTSVGYDEPETVEADLEGHLVNLGIALDRVNTTMKLRRLYEKQGSRAGKKADDP